MNGAGAVQGFQVPPEIKQRKGKLDELLSANDDLNGAQVLIFISSLDPSGVQGVVQQLDDGDYESLADSVRQYVTREFVRKKMPESHPQSILTSSTTSTSLNTLLVIRMPP